MLSSGFVLGARADALYRGCRSFPSRRTARQAPLLDAQLPCLPSTGHLRGSGAPRHRLWRRGAPCWVRRTDTDAYEADLAYDSDDYYDSPCADAELSSGSISRQGSNGSGGRAGMAALQPAALAAAAAAAVTAAAHGVTGVQRAGQAQEQKGASASPADAPAAAEPGTLGRDTLRAVVLLASAALVFLQRMQVAVLATMGATLLLLQQLARLGSAQARRLGLRVRRGLRRSSAGDRVEQLLQSARDMGEQLPEDFWGKLLWLWDRPPVQKLRLTWSLANISIKLPAVLALVATQVGLLASQVSLPMLAPLLLGTGMLLRSIKSNASFLLPRIGLFVVLAWLLWFANSVVQSTVAYLRRQGALDNRIASALITASECSALLGALLILLSMLGVNIGSALLLPAGIAVAIAAKDLSHNWLAGFFLFVAQPFKMGDRVAVSFSAPGAPGSFTSNWFEGVCEKIDLRYTSIRQGSRRLMVPNSAFLTREFMIMDDLPTAPAAGGPRDGAYAAAGVNGAGVAGGYGLAGYGGGQVEEEEEEGDVVAVDAMQQMMQQPPYHQELLSSEEAAWGESWRSGEQQQQQGQQEQQRGQQLQQQQRQRRQRANGQAFVPPPPTLGSMPWPAVGQPARFGREVPGYHSSAYSQAKAAPPGYWMGATPGCDPLHPPPTQGYMGSGPQGPHPPCNARFQ